MVVRSRAPLGALILSLTLFAVAPVWSATSDSKFAAQGAGLLTCAAYTQERKAASGVYQMVGGWIDGYVTGFNQQTPGVYSVLSFESTELVLALINEHCSKRPEDAVFGVLKLLIDKMSENGLAESSTKIHVTLGERSMRLYVETLRRMQQKFTDMDMYSGEINGAYDEKTQAAIRRYQESIEFEPTGFPDQLTLWRLFTDKS